MCKDDSSPEFEAAYTYAGDDLGCRWAPEGTAFRLWAPGAEACSVRLYAGGDPGAADALGELPMAAAENGTWVARQAGDLSGTYYTYLVTRQGRTVEAIDPYARSAGVNGQRGMILNLRLTDPPGWDEDVDPHFGLRPTDAVICELHLRDLSCGRGARFRHRGQYLGLTEAGLTTKGGAPVGLDHLRSLGVTHVHLLPVFDFGRIDEASARPGYNWGYDPVNYNLPEGSYSGDPRDGAARVRELKQAVKALHDAGLSAVMDVVYNHVYDREKFCINRIVPGYFSRRDAEGHWSAGSGCGNDTASERSMVRKYIVDSVKYWAEEYHFDGFRFDIVGLLDTETMNAVIAAVHESHPNVIFYGEGWTMDTKPTKPGVTLATQWNGARVPGLAFFNDTLRDMLRGSEMDIAAPGFVTGAEREREAIDACFLGCPPWAQNPSQCINYASCHDGATLFDRIASALPEEPPENRIRRNNLAAAFCLLSEGIPFFQAGEEFLRSKPRPKGGFDTNSYRSPDRVNGLRWDSLDTPECAQTVQYYRGLIALRKAHPALRLATRDAVLRQVQPVPLDSPRSAAYRITEGAQELYIAFNADTAPLALPLPEGEPWQAQALGTQAGIACLGQFCGSISVPPLSAAVLVRRRLVEVVAALIWEKDKFLICQRPAGKARGLLWEFVGGKVEPGESHPEALIRECREELGITVEVGREFLTVVHSYPDILIRLTLYHCTIAAGVPQLLEHNALSWIHPSEVGAYDFCPADTEILTKIQQTYSHTPPL